MWQNNKDINTYKFYETEAQHPPPSFDWCFEVCACKNLLRKFILSLKCVRQVGLSAVFCAFF